jgi:glutathione S-transferase
MTGTVTNINLAWVSSVIDSFALMFITYSDLPNLPYLIDGNLKLTQSKAILYYLGRKLGLIGKNLQEEAFVMMFCEQAHDLRVKFSQLCYGPDGDSESAKKTFVDTTLTQHLTQFDAYLAKNKTRFAVGNQPTVADFQLFSYIDCSCLIDGGLALLNKYTNVKELLQRIRELPELKEYIVKSHAQLPINGSGEC